MLPLNPWEHQNMMKTFYSKCVEDVCKKHEITRMELDILLFLANNPCFDTASDIVEIRYLSKSQVSTSIKMLEGKGFLQKKYETGNRKTVHLVICEAAQEILEDGRKAQECFIGQLFDGLTPEERKIMKQCTEKMLKNIRQNMKGSEPTI